MKEQIIVTYCDRCGKKFTENNYDSCTYITLVKHYYSLTQREKREIDLCDSCQESFDYWFEVEGRKAHEEVTQDA